jgi:hypothetical protein
MPRNRLVAFGVMLLLGFAATEPALAQPPATSIDQLPARVRVGDDVWVTGEDGREVKGKLWNLTPSSVEVMSRGRTTTFDAGSLRTMAARKPDSLRNGAIIGLGIGLGLASLAAFECKQYAPCFVVGGAFYAGLGAAAGVGIDALTPTGRMEVYRRTASQSARITLVPAVAARSQGIVLRIAF